MTCCVVSSLLSDDSGGGGGGGGHAGCPRGRDDHSLAPNGAIVVGRELVIVRILVRILEVVLRRVGRVVVLIVVVTVGILVPPAPGFTFSVFLSVYPTLVLREGPFSSTWTSPIIRTPPTLSLKNHLTLRLPPHPTLSGPFYLGLKGPRKDLRAIMD